MVILESLNLKLLSKSTVKTDRYITYLIQQKKCAKRMILNDIPVDETIMRHVGCWTYHRVSVAARGLQVPASGPDTAARPHFDPPSHSHNPHLPLLTHNNKSKMSTFL